MPENYGEGTLRILARERVCICACASIPILPMLFIIFLGYSLTCVTHAGIVDLNADLVCLRRRDLDVLDCKILASLPRDSCL